MQIDPYEWIRDTLCRRTKALAARVQEDFLQAYFKKSLGFHDSAPAGDPPGESDFRWPGVIQNARSLLDALGVAARSVIVQTARDFDRAGPLTASLEGGSREDRVQSSAWNAAIQGVASKILECGGARRLIAVMPQGPVHVQLVDAAISAWGVAPDIVFDSADEAILCCEMEQLSLPLVAAQLIDYRPDYLQAAGRLHTRTDVEWQPLCRVRE